MAIKRGCSDRWRGGTPMHRGAPPHAAPDRPCTNVPKRSFPDLVPRRRAKYAHLGYLLWVALLDPQYIAGLRSPCASPPSCQKRRVSLCASGPYNISMEPSIISRLISARYLLSASGPPLNQHSDSRRVAHAVLIAHDAAELTLGATSEYLKTGLSDRATFPEILDAIDRKLANGLPGRDFFNRLNKVRVGFKHHGELPDAGSWYGVVEDTTNRLDALCEASFGFRLETADNVQLIEDKRARALVEDAKTEMATGRFKESLEKLALALHRAGISFPPALSLAPGEPDPQLTLMLTGYGIDPSSFTVLQQLLPRVLFKDVEWKLRRTGHPMNWNQDNVSFCLRTVVEIILLLQHASPRPHPLNFYDVYRDVVTINAENPDVREGVSFMLGLGDNISGPPTTPLSCFLPGDKIYGKVVPSVDRDGEITDEDWNVCDLEWIKVDQPSCDKRKFKNGAFLTVRREHVIISYEEDPHGATGILKDMTPSDVEKFREALYDV